MIRAILVVGWLGMLLLLAAAATGYPVTGEETAQRHLVVALFATAALLFTDLCLVTYLLGTRHVVRRTVAEHGLGGSWTADHAPLVRRGSVAGLLAAAALAATFGIGFSTFARFVPPWIHHGLAGAAAALQVAALLLGARVLRRGEELLADLGRTVEGLGYTAPSAAAGRGEGPAPDS